MACSSRWRAWPAGRCTLQPICRSVFHTAPGVRRTPKRASINAAIRSSVHNSFAYPAAIAPPFSSCASSSNWTSKSWRRRPRWPTVAMCLMPPASSRRSEFFLPRPRLVSIPENRAVHHAATRAHAWGARSIAVPQIRSEHLVAEKGSEAALPGCDFARLQTLIIQVHNGNIPSCRLLVDSSKLRPSQLC